MLSTGVHASERLPAALWPAGSLFSRRSRFCDPLALGGNTRQCLLPRTGRDHGPLCATGHRLVAHRGTPEIPAGSSLYLGCRTSMVPHPSVGGRADRRAHAQSTAQAVVSEKADASPGSHRLSEWSAAGCLYRSPLTGRAGLSIGASWLLQVHDFSAMRCTTSMAIGDSWLPGLALVGVGRDIPGHLVRSECRRVTRLPGKVKKDG
jgi:hypothetical protein